MENNTIEHSDYLSKDKYPQGDLFFCDVLDAPIKDLSDWMETPFFSLSKKPEVGSRVYEHGNIRLEITSSAKGLPTIFDKDILIFATSCLIDAANRGEPLVNKVRFSGVDLLRFINKGTTGRDYEAIESSFVRLRGMTLSTTIRRQSEDVENIFGVMDDGKVIRQDVTPEEKKAGKKGRLIACEITFSDWFMEALEERLILSFHRDYFRLRRPMERRLYEIGRKHCGHQESWSISLPLLHKKSGSKAPLPRFRHEVKGIAETDHLPDYRLTFDADKDQLTYNNRETMPKIRDNRKDKSEQSDSDVVEQLTQIRLRAETYNSARQMAPGWDVHALEREWLGWTKTKPHNPDAAFIAFCRKWAEKRGKP